MNDNLHCNYCEHPRAEDKLTQGKDRLTKQDAWTCSRHRSFLMPAPKRKSKTEQHMDKYGLYRGA